MKDNHIMLNTLRGTVGALLVMAITPVAMATEPCDDFGECKVLIEMNTTDGDIGFHFLVDGDDLNSVQLHDPNHTKVFQDMAKGPLHEQKITETFTESAEPLCREELKEDEDDEVVTLEEFLERWTAGIYVFSGSADGGEKLEGETVLTYEFPAAPADLMFDDETNAISWAEGDDLGVCATESELDDLVAAGAFDYELDDEFVTGVHPKDVEVTAWEIVFEPDVDIDEDEATDEELEAADALSKLKFTIRVAGDIDPLEVTVPAEYIASLPDNQLIKIEVGALGATDNATFTEIFDICVNAGCDEDE